MILDPRTLLFLTCLSTLFLGLAMFVAARAYADYVHGMKHWAWGCAMQSLAWTLAAGRGHLPDALSIVAGNTLLTASLGLQLGALQRFWGGKESWPVRALSYAPTLVVFALCHHYTYAAPDLAARIAVISLGTAPLLLACAATIFRGRRGRLPFSHGLTALGFLASAGATLGRAALVLVGGQAPPSFLSPGALQTAAFLWVFVAALAITLGYAAMCGGRYNAEMRRLAMHDAVTGSLNRNAIDLMAQKELRRALRSGAPLSLLMLDVDHFKAVNDAYGHLAGDRVLQGLVGCVGGHLRSYDLIGRFGGEEFLIVLPGTASESAFQIAERMRSLVEQSILTEGPEMLRYTISIGVATLGAGEVDYQTLLRRADAALYSAKGQGRNRVMVAPPFTIAAG